ncbi:MAG: hypothetical protein WCT39_04060 [Candidatus Margulisiibacteriota bacterium]
MKKLWIKKFSSFKEAEKADQQDYSNLSPAERLDIIQFLRESYFRAKGMFTHDGRSRLRRSVKILQQT